MSEQGNIICPNCGAINEHYGKCEYCGNTLEGDSKAEVSMIDNEGTPISNQSIICKYDKFENKVITTSKKPCSFLMSRYLLDFQHEKSSKDKERLYITLCLSFVKYKRLSFDTLHLVTDNIVFKFDASDLEFNETSRFNRASYEIDPNILLAICRAEKVSIKIKLDNGESEAIEDTDNTIRLLARRFYNRVYDSSMFKEEVESVELKESEDEKKRIQRKAERLQREEQENKRLEKMKGGCSVLVAILAVILFVVLCLIIILS